MTSRPASSTPPSTRGGPDDLIELQNKLATELLALHVSLSSEEQAALRQRSKETLDGYRRLADTFGAPEASPPPGKRKGSWLAWPARAWAADVPAARSNRSVRFSSNTGAPGEEPRGRGRDAST